MSSTTTSPFVADEGTDGGVIVIAGAVMAAVLKIVMLTLVGAKLEHQGVLNAAKRKALSALAMDVCLPCLLFADVLPDADARLLTEGWELLLWPLIYCSVGGLLAVVLLALSGTPSQHWGAAAACASCPNVNGFPVSIIKALNTTLPRSPAGFSAMTFLAIIQLTDGMIKYTVGPMLFRRDLRAMRRARAKRGVADDEDDLNEMPLGASMLSFPSGFLSGTPKARTPKAGARPSALDAPECARSDSIREGEAFKDAPGHDATVTEFGLTPRQFKCVQPDWSRLDSGRVMWSNGILNLDDIHANAHLHEPLLAGDGSTPTPTQPKSFANFTAELGRRLRASGSSCFDLFRELFPPQVTAVILALALGVGPPCLKRALYDPALTAHGKQAPLGWLYATAQSLGGGFVPLQMIALGGRMLNVVGPTGPLTGSGEAGPRGRTRLLRIAAVVGVVRMLLTPLVLYVLALWFGSSVLGGARPIAFWAPAFVVVAMPTANNMSTMADLIGSGRSISAAGVAMQLIASPVVLTVTLTALLAGAKDHLALDMVDD